MLKSQKRSTQYILFFWIAFLVVITLNFFIWLYLNQVEEQFKNELKGKLSSLNRMITKLIEFSDIGIGYVQPGDRSGLEYLYIQQLFDDLRRSNELQNILFISKQQEILISSPEILSTQLTLSLDADPYYQQATNGNPAVTELESHAGQKFMSAYAPIRNIDGLIMGVIVIEARADYFEVISNLRNRLIVFSLINFLLITLFALLLWRLIKRTIQYQSAMQQQEHLAKLGTMAATVAHEIRNPLNIIQGTNDLLKKKYGRSSDELFSYIPEEIKRLSILIDNFLNFAKTPRLHIEKKSLRYLIERIDLSLDRRDKQRVVFNKAHWDMEFSTDHSLLEQVMSNLLKNALQASTDTDEVRVDLIHLRRGRVKIEIKDHGEGIPVENLNKIFDPFFTTKDQGTGLGLAISKRIIDQLNGTLQVQSLKNQGTLAEVILSDLRKV